MTSECIGVVGSVAFSAGERPRWISHPLLHYFNSRAHQHRLDRRSEAGLVGEIDFQVIL